VPLATKRSHTDEELEQISTMQNPAVSAEVEKTIFGSTVTPAVQHTRGEGELENNSSNKTNQVLEIQKASPSNYAMAVVAGVSALATFLVVAFAVSKHRREKNRKRWQLQSPGMWDDSEFCIGKFASSSAIKTKISYNKTHMEIKNSLDCTTTDDIQPVLSHRAKSPFILRRQSTFSLGTAILSGNPANRMLLKTGAGSLMALPVGDYPVVAESIAGESIASSCESA
jgi:hypothetical protein